MAKIDRHYQDELTRLHEMAAEYAQLNPSQAGYLAGAGSDPDVERILEGVAFLTAGLRAELEKDQTQLLQNILQVASPDLLRPLPSVTLMQFKGRPALKDSLPLPIGTSVAGVTSDQRRCEFKTLMPTRVLPLELGGANLRKSHDHEPGVYCLALDFTCSYVDVSALSNTPLDLYLNSPQGSAARMLDALLNHSDAAELSCAGQSFVIDLPQWNTDLLLWPWLRDDAPELPAQRMVQRYFLAPELGQGVRVQLPMLNAAGEAREFQLLFYMDAGTDWPRGDLKKIIKLHVVPAANLFVRDAPPRIRDHRQPYMALTPRQRDDERVSVYGLDQVSGQYRSQSDSRRYQPFWQQGLGDPRYYQEQLVAHPVTDELELSVALGGEVRDEQEVIKARLFCTNGPDAAGLLPGQINAHISGSPELVQFENITTPSPYRKALPSDQQYWQAVRQLSSNLMGHLTLERLLAALKELALQASPDRARQQINLKKIDAIQSVDLKMTDRLVSAMSARGYEVSLALAGDHFPGKGDMHLFARLLQQFFINLVPVNYFCLLKVKDLQTGEWVEWPPMLGRKPLL